MRVSLCLLFLISILNGLKAQDSKLWTSEKTKILSPGIDSVLIDSLPVVISSLKLRSIDPQGITPTFEIKGTNYSYLIFSDPIKDSLKLTYSTVPLPLNQSFKHKDSSLILPSLSGFKPKLYEVQTKNDFKPFDGLNSKGSISRAISIGSNQDAVLTSSLNLQLAGKLGRDTEIRASITDNNIPVQSDGYSQQLREFDRVYIELENNDFGLLRAGDFNITSKENYFLKFDKRISGAAVYSTISWDDKSIPFQMEGGIARGKFTRNRFTGQEGNQGPYKLTGANGERFVIIISGSEKVYIDGVLMKRGQQFDYVMDYNAGEIIFTNLQPITKEKRIAVEFQYTEQNYLRSVAFGSVGFQNSNLKTSVQFYSEQDSKNQSLVQDLSDQEKSKLNSVGDDLSSASISTIFPSAFSEGILSYELKDSLGFDSVLVFSVDTTKQLYQASFTFVGQNKGNYQLSQSQANGRVFKWVAPSNGIAQGSYSPIRQLVAPNQLQIFTFQNEWAISENQNLQFDLAFSKNDINLFSDIDKENDIGAAAKALYSITGKLKKWQWFGDFNLEFNQENFRTIERIRRVEFARDWNLPLEYNGATQMLGAEFGLKKEAAQVAYGLDYLQINSFNGFKNKVGAHVKTKTQILDFDASWLSTKDSIGKSQFLREQFLYRYNFSEKFWAGVKSIGEYNVRRLDAQNSLLNTSYAFLQNDGFVGFGDTAESFVELFYSNRRDDTASNGLYKNFSQANTYGLKSSYKTKFNSKLQFFLNSRNLKIFLPEEREIDRTISSRINYVHRFFKNAIISTTFYETGAGREAKRNFSYVEVPAGTGSYTHTDYNGNGLRELDEFEIAPNPDQAKFVRIFTASNEYVRTNLNKFGQNLNIKAPYEWKAEKGLRNKLAYFSLLLNYQLDRKTLLDGNQNNLNPFKAIENDTLIVALNNSSRASIFFNRSSSIFGIDYTYLLADTRNLLSFGVEKRATIENSINLRYRFLDPLLFRTTVKVVDKSNVSQNFGTRNFNISELGNLYSLSYQANDKFLITGSYQWNNQNGESEDLASLSQQDFGFNMNYNLAETVNLIAEANYILNTFEGETNSPVAFDMLDGLQPGENGKWSLSLQRTIRKNILISLSYNGRISENSLPINTGSLQVKAFF